MNILQALVRLRDDLKLWVTNNLMALKEEVDSKSTFSGNYNDLSNKPDIPSIDGLASETYVNNVVDNVVNNAVDEIIDSAPETLNTLNELARALGNNPDFATDMATELGKKANKSELFSGNYEDLTNKPEIPNAYIHPNSHPASMIIGLSTVATSGNYEDLINKPVIPTVTNDLTDELKANYNTAYKHSQSNHFDGNYNSLTNKPTIPSVVGLATETYVNNAVAGIVDSAPETLNTLNELAQALGDDPNFATTVSTEIGKKANSNDLAAVATSGSYNDLTNKPDIPMITNDLTDELKSNYDAAYEYSQSGTINMNCIDGFSGELLVAHSPSEGENSIFFSTKAYITSSGSIGTENNMNAKAFYEDGTALVNKYAAIEYVNEEITKLRDEMIILEEDDLTMDGLIDNTFPSLTTENKTLLGAINELNDKSTEEIDKAVIDEILLDVFDITIE